MMITPEMFRACLSLYVQRKVSLAGLAVWGVLTLLAYGLAFSALREVTPNSLLTKKVTPVLLRRAPDPPTTDLLWVNGSGKPGTWVYYRYLSLPECPAAPGPTQDDALSPECATRSTLLPVFGACATTHTVFAKVGRLPTTTDYDTSSCDPKEGALCDNFYVYIGVYMHSVRSGWRPRWGTRPQKTDFTEAVETYHCGKECNRECTFISRPRSHGLARALAPLFLGLTLAFALWLGVVTLAIHR
eukprot:RCo043616